jgi:predicted amidophosphoribosyltransferase
MQNPMQTITPVPPAIMLEDRWYSGWAIDSHTASRRLKSGNSERVRSDLADAWYRYRYEGETALFDSIAGTIARYVRAYFAEENIRLDCMLMLPPNADRPEYRRVIELSAAVSRALNIPSSQAAIMRTSNGSIAFPSPSASRLITGNTVLVIDDIFRSGRTLKQCCQLLMEEGKAAGVQVLVGTKVMNPK